MSGEAAGSGRVLDVRLDAVSLEEATRRMEAACHEGEPLHIVTINIDFLRLARRDSAFKSVLEDAGLAVCDGRLLKWAAALGRVHLPNQITGHDLLEVGLELARRRGLSVLLLGSGPGIAARAAERLREEHPDLQIAGLHHGRFDMDGRPEQPDALNARIRNLAPRLVFVGLGAPKQDRWIADNLRPLGIRVGVGVGSVIDVVAGELPRAPRWMQRTGLESVYQTLKAPRRYAKRYLVQDPPILARVLGESLWRRLSFAGRS